MPAILNTENYIGKRYGRLTIIEFDHCVPDYRKNGKRYGFLYYFKCKCDCGNVKVINVTSLTKGNTKSCGCVYRNDILKHGLRYTKLYSVYVSMKQRCYNHRRKDYINYGGRGIIICDEWIKSNIGVINFCNWAKNNGYKDGLTIDRIDVNGNYEPNNCRWTTVAIQNTNRRSNVDVNYNGEIMCLASACKKINMSYCAIYRRMFINNMSFNEAIKNPIRHQKNNR